VVTAQEEPKTLFTATPKRIFKVLGRLINSFSHFFNSSASIFCGQSTCRKYDFRILLEIGNFNLRRIAASLAFDLELSVAKDPIPFSQNIQCLVSRTGSAFVEGIGRELGVPTFAFPVAQRFGVGLLVGRLKERSLP
jgi:hypothetical protein